MTLIVRYPTVVLLLALLLQNTFAEFTPRPEPLCQALYSIRMGVNGSVDKVMDTARCQNADELFVRKFLNQLKPQLVAGILLDFEMTDCYLTHLERDLLNEMHLRRLTIQRSGLESLSRLCFNGQENTLEELDLSGNRLTEIPTALTNLTALVRLDLSKNRLSSLSQGVIFFRLLKLRHINLNNNRLGYLNTIGSADSHDHQLIPLSAFNLEPLREHIETILVARNNLTAFPIQFSRSFPRLQHLDLSANNLTSIQMSSFSQMPQLRRLNLDDNRLSHLTQFQLASALEVFSVRGNPLRCDCGAFWLWQLLHNRESAELSIDNCNWPEKWRGRHLLTLPPGFCENLQSDHTETHLPANKSNDNEATSVQEKGQPPIQDLGRFLSIDLEPASQTINVTFKLLQTLKQPLAWSIIYRQFASEQWSSQVMEGVLKEKTVSTSIAGLSPSTGYQVCIQMLTNTGALCHEVLTRPAKKEEKEPVEEEQVPVYPVTEIAVAASVSTSTTLVVVFMLCCCCPGPFKRGRKFMAKKGIINKAVDSPATSTSGEGSADKEKTNNEFFSISSVVLPECDLNTRPPTTASLQQHQQGRPMNFSTFRCSSRSSYAAEQSLRSTAVADENSHRMFQATCDYLRQRALDPSQSNLDKTVVTVNPISDGRQQECRASFDIQCSNVSHVTQPELDLNLQQRTPPCLYFNSAYGLGRQQSIEMQQERMGGKHNKINPSYYNNAASASVENAYKYCTWRPNRLVKSVRQKGNPSAPLSGWTSYADFLANSGGPANGRARRTHRLQANSLAYYAQPHLFTAVVPPYAMTISGHPHNRSRTPLYWSTAPTPAIQL